MSNVSCSFGLNAICLNKLKINVRMAQVDNKLNTVYSNKKLITYHYIL